MTRGANPSSYMLVLLTAGYVLNSLDRSIMGVLLEPIGREFGASDTQLGLLTGLAFAAFYSVVGIPIAAWADRSSRRTVIGVSMVVWSIATICCGLAVSFVLLLLARIGTAIGEAGGTPPSHSLISDHFPTNRRATALAIYSLGAPLGATLAGLWGGFGNEWLGWRWTLILAGVPGLLLAPLILLTIAEPPRSDSQPRSDLAAAFTSTARHLGTRRSFRHLFLACALHNIAIHSTSTFNATFLIRSHAWDTSDAGQLIAVLGICAALGTLLGGVLADRASHRFGDERWLLWVPAWATLAAIPLQVAAYLAPGTAQVSVLLPAAAMLSMIFFGPAFAVGQSLAAPHMRAVTTSVLLFGMAMIGHGLGPLTVGLISDQLTPVVHQHALRYALLLAPAINLWSVAHFFLAARSLRQELT